MQILFVLLGGLGLFLYGMETLSRGLQQAAGLKLKGFLRAVSGNRFLGVFSGALGTAIIQSSSVTTVMIVAFVNAGLMTLAQAISVILGAHIGTTITAQIIAFKIEAISLPLIGLGAGLHLFTSNERLKNIGEALFGFGILFLGLEFMSHAFDPLSTKDTVKDLLQHFAKNPLLGVLVGMVVTIVVQSSSVTTGITIALALSSLITFEQAVPLIIGENIGTTVTANIAALKSSVAAQQAARAHFIVNFIGALLALILLKPFMSLVLLISPGDAARQIANSHTLFNIFTTLLFLPFIGFVAKLSEFLVFGKNKTPRELFYLDRSSLQDPSTALDQVNKALIETHTLAQNLLRRLADTILKSSDAHFSSSAATYEKIERYRLIITSYIEKISTRALSTFLSKKIPAQVRVLHEIERIRDYSEKIMEVSRNLQREGRKLLPNNKKELSHFFKAVDDLMTRTGSVIEEPTQKKVDEIVEIHETLDARKLMARKNLHKRLRHGTDIATINYYYDLISTLEEIAKKCRNIALTVIE